jgi:Ca2+:H+ antiporter
MRRTLFCSYTTVLLVFVPIGIVAGVLGWPVGAVFLLNFSGYYTAAPIITFSFETGGCPTYRKSIF